MLLIVQKAKLSSPLAMSVPSTEVLLAFNSIPKRHHLSGKRKRSGLPNGKLQFILLQTGGRLDGALARRGLPALPCSDPFTYKPKREKEGEPTHLLAFPLRCH